MYRFPVVAGAALVVLGLNLGTAQAGWAESLFEQTEKNFGSVPRGPDLSHPFPIKNTTSNTVTITNVRASCGRCGSVALGKATLAPGEETVVLARMHTGQFEGTKTITVFVQFGQPSFDEVRLTVQADSHSDVQVAPERLDFGQVRSGSNPRAATTITLYGNPPARVTGVECESSYVRPEWSQARRTGGEAAYDVAAKLSPETPVGRWYTELWVKTDNPGALRLRVPVAVEVAAGLNVSPSAVSLGEVKVGEERERKVTVRGARPFVITRIEGGGHGLEVRDTSGPGSRDVHILSVKLSPEKAGEWSRTIKVFTDLKQQGPVEFQAKGRAAP